MAPTPPQYGSRLLPTVLDETAHQQPNLTYAYIPSSNNNNNDGGFSPVTFSQIATATNYMAAWIHAHLGGPSTAFETIAYMGHGGGDLRYVVVFLAAVKCGYKVLLPSPRNAAWMNASLLSQTQCQHLLFAPEVETITTPLQQQQQLPKLKLHKMIPFADMLTDPNTPHYPYHQSYDKVKDHPILILPSSGSTGPPKPITMTHATFAVGDHDRLLPPGLPGRTNQNWSLWDFPAPNTTYFAPFPAFHLAGFSALVMLPIYYQNAKPILTPKPATGSLVREMMGLFPETLKAIFCPPIVAEQLVQEGPEFLTQCSNLRFLLYAGGPLSAQAGDALSRVTAVCQFYGQTETGAIQALVPHPRENWASLEWNPVQEVIMEPFDDGGSSSDDPLYEMTMRRNPALEKVRSVTANFPNVEIWRTRDLFTRHQGDGDSCLLWRFHGRVDDIVVLSNGEKFNPVPSEVLVSTHPLVGGALVVGQGYPQPALLLEPKDPAQKLEELVKAIWPTVEKANAQAPSHGRITRDMILLSVPRRPLVRSAKGTVVRPATVAAYKDDIKQLFARDVSRNLEGIHLADVHDQVAVMDFVQKVVASAFPRYDEGVVGVKDDLFVAGLDSLQAMEITKLVKAGLRAAAVDGDWLSVKTIYAHASIEELARVIVQACSFNSDDDNGKAIQSNGDNERVQRMQAMLDRYTKDLPTVPLLDSNADTTTTQHHVILTGATGSLGTHILTTLLSDPAVAHITCLDRSANAKARIQKALSSSSSLLDMDRVSFHQANYTAPNFGLPESVHQTATMILHAAWQVDFLHSLATFEDIHIRSIRTWIEFCASAPSSRRRPRLVFISSVSSVADWPITTTITPVIPETMPPSLAAAMSNGYAESKAVAEHLLAAATGIDRVVLRVGQIAGPSTISAGQVDSTWNENEWFPSMIKTAKAMGKIPDARTMGGEVDWIPVDLVAAAVWELSQANKEEKKDEEEDEDKGNWEVFHVVNPCTRAWEDVLAVVKSRIAPVQEVSLDDWVKALEETEDSEVEAKPAVKVVDFFRGLRDRKGENAVYGTRKATTASETMRGLGPVTDDDLVRWMHGWGC